MYTGGPKGPFWDQKSPNKASMPMSQIGLKWSKWYQMMNITCFSSFGTILGPFGLFWIISDKTWFFAPNHFGQEALFCFEAKNFCFVWNDPKESKWAQNDHKWPRICYIDHFGSFWDPRKPLWNISNPAMFGHFWPKKGFFGPPAHMIKGWQGSKLLQTNFVYV